jgi:hypothetical protein
MQRQINRLKWNINIEQNKLHQLPRKGKMISHLNSIQTSYYKYKNGTGKQHLLILEDDAKILNNVKQFNNLPKSYDILYLGGRVGIKYANWNEEWVRMSTYDNHAYILNLAKTNFIDTLLHLGNKYLESHNDDNWKQGLASYNYFMRDNIHCEYKCYMINPELIVQTVDKSSIDNNIYKNPHTMALSVNGFSIPEHQYEDTNYIMKLGNINEELPNVNLLTILNDTKLITYMSLAMFNFDNLQYPKNKLKWHIINCFIEEYDDKDIYQLLNNHKHIHYHRIVGDNNFSLGTKLNYLVSNSQNKYFAIFDIYHLYMTENIDARIKCMLKYPEVNCLGCDTVGVYNLLNSESGIHRVKNYQLYFPSLAFTRKYWKNNNFLPLDNPTEIVEHFTKNKYQQLMTLPYESVIYCIKDEDINYNIEYEKSIKDFMECWQEDSDYANTIQNLKNKNTKYKFTQEELEILKEMGELD